MRRSKKDLDMESMFQKIMPSAAGGKVENPIAPQAAGAADSAGAADALNDVPEDSVDTAQDAPEAESPAAPPKAKAASKAKTKAKAQPASVMDVDASALTVEMHVAGNVEVIAAGASPVQAPAPAEASAPAEAPTPAEDVLPTVTHVTTPVASVAAASVAPELVPVANAAPGTVAVPSPTAAPPAPSAPVAPQPIAVAEATTSVTAAAPAAPLEEPLPFPDPDTIEEPMLVNLARPFLESRLGAALDKFKCCKCEKCQLDVLAVALNKVPPQYAMLPQGAEPLAYVTSDFAREAVTGLIQSILQIKSHPRH